MVIETLYKIGDSFSFGGVYRIVVGVHIYVSDSVQTERYYLGNGDWVTVQRFCK